MRIAQVLLSSASNYERKSQRIDLEALREKHELVPLADAQIAHVYASGVLPGSEFVGFPVPYVSAAPLKDSRWSLRKPRQPSLLISPLGEKPVPEAVETRYFEARGERRISGTVIGSFARPGTQNMVEQTLARIHRFRDDVTWNLFESAPEPGDLAGVDVWVDPAVDESDLDGFTAEALVVGLPVVAARQPINSLRLEQGRCGWLVPPRDPNEMTHAILAALFKPEVAENKLAAARQTISKYRARQRVRVLGQIYETLIQ